MFEEEMTEVQVDMIDICNEYSCGAANKIFIYVGYENILNVEYFYEINNIIVERHKLNTLGLNVDFDTSIECQKQVINILKNNVKLMKNICEKYNQPIPTEMKLIYETKTKQFKADYKYEKQTNDNVSVFDNADKWFNQIKG